LAKANNPAFFLEQRLRPEMFFGGIAETACDYVDRRCEAAQVPWYD
jgi:hypothetical protein